MSHSQKKSSSWCSAYIRLLSSRERPKATTFAERQRRKVDFKPMGYKGTLRNVVRSHGGSGTAVPDGLAAAMVKVRLRVANAENRAVGFIAAQRHFTRPFWRNYFGRAEMRTLRAVTGTRQATKAAALTVSRSPSLRSDLRDLSGSVLKSFRSSGAHA